MQAQELDFKSGYAVEEWRRMDSSRKKRAIFLMAIDAGLDQCDRDYVIANLDFYDRFIEEAHRVVYKGFRHYSGYTIKEFLRHHTSVETTGVLFKINDHIVPKVTRLSMQMFPMLNNLFETRK